MPDDPPSEDDVAPIAARRRAISNLMRWGPPVASRQRERETNNDRAIPVDSEPGVPDLAEPNSGDEAEDEGEGDDEQQLRYFWPPVAVGKKGEQRLPPRLRTSPRLDAKGREVTPKNLDFTITMTPLTPKSTDDNPHPSEPPDSLCVQSCRHFMLKTLELWEKLLNIDKTEEGSEDALVLIEVSAGVERGEKNGHAHVQMAVRVRTRRSLRYTKELLELLLKALVYAHAELLNRISIVARGTQSQLYNLGYTFKDIDEGDHMLGGTLELLLHTVCSIGIPIRERCIYHAMHGMQRSLQVYTRYSGVYGGRGRGKQKVRNS